MSKVGDYFNSIAETARELFHYAFEVKSEEPREDSSAVNPPPVQSSSYENDPGLAFVMSPGFQAPAELRDIVQTPRISPSTNQTAPVVAEEGGILSGVAAFFGFSTGVVVGTMAAGPGPFLVSSESGIDYQMSRVEKLLSDKELFALTSYLAQHPEDESMLRGEIAKALVKPTLKKQREELIILIQAVASQNGLPQKVPALDPIDGNAEPPLSGVYDTASRTARSEDEGTCPSNMVYVPEGIYGKVKYPSICVDEHEYTDTANRKPTVNIKWSLASAFCNAQGKRLPTFNEWARVASDNGTKKYSTRTGDINFSNPAKIKGVHYKADESRAVCLAKGAYIAYQGNEICDLSGNVSEWTSDHYVAGGSYLDFNPNDLRANDRISTSSESDDYIGFRCVSNPQKSSK